MHSADPALRIPELPPEAHLPCTCSPCCSLINAEEKIVWDNGAALLQDAYTLPEMRLSRTATKISEILAGLAGVEQRKPAKGWWQMRLLGEVACRSCSGLGA